jgi:soluble lytic murein transglycosylase-like protein
MNIGTLVAAILTLSPGMPAGRASDLADVILREARWYDVDPFDVVAVITVESAWKSDKKSKTHDFGLMQVHTARNGSARFWGRERELLDPRTNIREGVRILSMWQRYHKRQCETWVDIGWDDREFGAPKAVMRYSPTRVEESKHDALSHYKWGKVPRGEAWAAKVRAIGAWLRALFGVIS